jgi:hypothetical protein
MLMTDRIRDRAFSGVIRDVTFGAIAPDRYD